MSFQKFCFTAAIFFLKLKSIININISNLNVRELDPPNDPRQIDANCGKIRLYE